MTGDRPSLRRVLTQDNTEAEETHADIPLLERFNTAHALESKTIVISKKPILHLDL
jgi:hypothetical protein